MKREPDRLDFLIVLLPVILVGLLGFQVYEYVQMNRQRLATQHVRDSRPPAPAPRTPEPSKPGGSAPPGSAEQDVAGEQEAPATRSGGDGEPQAEPPPEERQDPSDSAGETTPTSTVDPETAAAEAGILGAGGDAMEAGNGMGDDAAAGGAAGQGADPEPQPEPVVPEPQPAAEQVTPPPAAIPQRSAPPGARRRRGDTARPAAETLTGGTPAQVTVMPRTNPARVGEIVAVDVVLRDGADVNGVVFHVRFDPATLQLNEEPQAELGAFFAGESDTELSARPLPNGKVVVTITRPPGQEGLSGDGILATFHFEVLAPGETRIDLLQTAIRDALNQPQQAMVSNATLLTVE